MKVFIFTILLFSISVNLLSQEISELSDRTDKSMLYYNKVEYDINASLRFIFPVQEISFLSLVDFYAGIGYGIIPRYYYIGIAGDVAIGLDWLALFSEDKEKKDDNKREYNQF